MLYNKSSNSSTHHNQIRAPDTVCVRALCGYISTITNKDTKHIASDFSLVCPFGSANKTLTDFCFSCLRVSSQIGVIYSIRFLHSIAIVWMCGCAFGPQVELEWNRLSCCFFSSCAVIVIAGFPLHTKFARTMKGRCLTFVWYIYTAHPVNSN